MSGSDAMTLSIVHLTVSRCRVVPGPTLALALTRGSSKAELRVGAKPPSSVQRVMISFEQAHCMKSQAASMCFEYLDSARIDPPWWPTLGISPKPASAGGGTPTIEAVGGWGCHSPFTFESLGARPGKTTAQLWTSATWPDCIIWNWPSQVEAVDCAGACFSIS